MGPGSEPDVPWEPEGEEKVAVSSTLELPKGSIVQHTVMVIAYFDEDGGQKYAWATRGESTVASAVGLIEMVKAHMLAETVPS